MSQTTTSTTATAEQQPVTALTGAAAAVYTELCGQEAVTACALALAAEVSPSAARKALVTLEQQGLAWRTPGGNDRTRKLPDLWHPATPGGDPTPAHQADAADAAESLDGEVEMPQNPEAVTDEHGGGGTSPQPGSRSGAGDTSDVDQQTTADEGVTEDQNETAELPHDGADTAHEGTGDGVLPHQAPKSEMPTVADAEPEVQEQETLGSADESTGLPGSAACDAFTAPQADSQDEEAEPAPGDVLETPDSAEPGSEPTAPDGATADVSEAAGTTEEGATGPTDPDDGSGLADTAAEEAGAAGDEVPVASADHVCICATCGTQVRPRARKRIPAAVISGGPRLMPGALHGMVLDHLRANPDQEWTPTAIAKILGRSSGAIGNALTTMVDRVEAVMTCAKPRRYQAARTGTTEAPSTE